MCIKSEENGIRKLNWDGNISLQAGKTHVQKFNFRPDSNDVGKNLMVEKVIVGMGHSSSGLTINLQQIIPKEKIGRPPYETDFPNFSIRKQLK